MLIKIYFSPNMGGMADYQSYEIQSFDELLKLLPQAWLDLSETYQVEENSSEAFIIASISDKNHLEINCASFAFNDGELSINITEFLEANDPEIKCWKKVGLDTNKLYAGEDGLKEIINTLLKLKA